MEDWTLMQKIISFLMYWLTMTPAVVLLPLALLFKITSKISKKYLNVLSIFFLVLAFVVLIQSFLVLVVFY